MKYVDRHKLFAGKVIISYPFAWGGQFTDRKWWMAELNGEVEDYAPKKQLIANAIYNNRAYVVLRVHKNSDITIMENG